MKNKNVVRGLGAALLNKKAHLFLFSSVNAASGTFTVRESDDGITFDTLTPSAKVVDINGPSDDFDVCTSFHMSKDGRDYFLTYRHEEEGKMCVAQSRNLIDWEKLVELEDQGAGGKIVSEYLYAGRNVMFVGGSDLNAFVSEDLEKWSRMKKSLISFNKDSNGEKDLEKRVQKEHIEVIDAEVVDDGVFVMYSITTRNGKKERFEIHGALFDYGNPTEILWQSAQAIYTIEDVTKDNVRLFGAVIFDDYFVSYWMDGDDEMFLLRHFYKREEETDPENQDEEDTGEDEESGEDVLTLERVEQNPIMSPQENLSWESKAVYNPTAIEDDGKVHIIYRADGDDLMSVWGYAFTEDGATIKRRLANHIYSRDVGIKKMTTPRITSYTSGGNSNGGCEDPRAVLIDGVVYVTFTAFDGWGSVRVGLTSIDFEDFKNCRWNWHDTRLISPEGEMNKNWVIFPEKINDKFAILHSFCPEVLIDYVDDLSSLGYGNCIKSNNTRPIDPSRTWDSWFRGVGPAPIKTDDGWLIIYHAMDHRNPDRYRIGALLLDLNNPTQEICRTQKPILEPEATYENNGIKWGVIYCCGAVIKDDTLFVYYGGSDTYVCVATAPIAQFLDDLKKTGEVRMKIN